MFHTTTIDCVCCCFFGTVLKVEQALAVRVLDRLVAGADEDAFEPNNAATAADGDGAGYRSSTASRRAPGAGSNNNLPLSAAAGTSRRRLSASPALSVSGARHTEGAQQKTITNMIYHP